jgi:alkyldihydroxyacetonephosphate synthase
LSERKRKFWGWGYEDAGPSEAQGAAALETLSKRFGRTLEAAPAPRVEEIELAAPRVAAPGALAPLLRDDPEERLGHTYGKAYRDVVRALRRDFRAAPDWVALPRDEGDIVAILDWCGDARLAAIPYGGGSSVMGGTEARLEAYGDRYAGAVSIDLRRLDRVLEIDRRSRAARIQAGVLGPALEDQLRPHGLTLRHFPQSFEVSSLGGWIATRSGGHYATLYTHIDEFVESLRVVTPAGTSESRRLPGSGAGPSHDRLFIGSEGTLGIITEAWMRLQDRPSFRSGAAIRFPGAEGFLQAAECVRRLGQAGLFPSNCRLLDTGEARNSGATTEDESVLLVAFESADHSVDPWTSRALELCRDAGGVLPEQAPATKRGDTGARDGAAGAWRDAFLNLPYMRDVLTRASVIVDTFETAITWDRFESFHEQVIGATRDAVKRVCGQGTVACRFTHVYPDGPAPYYTITAPGRPGDELTQWDEIKAAAGDAVIAAGGTITHHHAVGRDHRPWYDRQISPTFAATLRAAKAELDPNGVLNPGVLIDPA